MTIEPRHPHSPTPTHPIAPTQLPGKSGVTHRPPHSPAAPPHRDPPRHETPRPDTLPGVGKPVPGIVDPIPPVVPPIGPIIVR